MYNLFSEYTIEVVRILSKVDNGRWIIDMILRGFYLTGKFPTFEDILKPYVTSKSTEIWENPNLHVPRNCNGVYRFRNGYLLTLYLVTPGRWFADSSTECRKTRRFSVYLPAFLLIDNFLVVSSTNIIRSFIWKHHNLICSVPNVSTNVASSPPDTENKYYSLETEPGNRNIYLITIN